MGRLAAEVATWRGATKVDRLSGSGEAGVWGGLIEISPDHLEHGIQAAVRQLETDVIGRKEH